MFPEDGICGTTFTDRDSIANFLEYIPDPKTASVAYNPCRDANKTTQPVQSYLSCLANATSLYIVANMASSQPCDISDPNCPDDAQYQYNTNIVLDDKGVLIARYHKTTLYGETQFDQPERPEFIYFNTPFGKIGTFVCFDVLFETPGIDLVERYDVDTIVFTTAWMNEFPFMNSVDFHESWAIRMGVNFLSANLHLPAWQMTGSGIFSGADGTVSYYQNTSLLSEPQLVIADVPQRAPWLYSQVLESIQCHGDNDAGEQCQTFTALMEGDEYTFMKLCDQYFLATISINNIKCSVNYKVDKSPSEFYALAAYNGLHVSEHSSYIQVCAVVACSTTSDCGLHHPMTGVSFITLTGMYDTSYVFPSVRLPEGRLDKSRWGFGMDKYKHIFKINLDDVSEPIQSIVLYGRVYSKDDHTSSTDLNIIQSYCYEHISKHTLSQKQSHHSLSHGKVALIVASALGLAVAIVAIIYIGKKRFDDHEPGRPDHADYIPLT